MRPNDTLTLLVGGQGLRGWQETRITRGLERCPSDFDFSLTERFPGQAASVIAEPGQTCEVRIGSDVVLTGYLDMLAPEINVRGHQVRAQGRSKCSDLVDCSAVLPNMAVNVSSLAQLANDLCKPFGITVSQPDGPGSPLVSIGGGVPPFNIALGETPFEIIERVGRWNRLLAYDDTAGNLVLAKVGTKTAASGAVQGKNVQTASVAFRKDERFTVYLPAMFSTETLSDLNSALGTANANRLPPVEDAAAFANQRRADGQPRYRPKFVVSEQQLENVNLAQARAEWEKSRRYGRSQAVNVTLDSWRDSAGALWAPNTLVPLDLPVLKVVGVTWLVSEVTYRRGRDGTLADLVLMPPEAFAPEPIFAAGFDWQIVKALAGNQGANFNPRAGERQGGT